MTRVLASIGGRSGSQPCMIGAMPASASWALVGTLWIALSPRYQRSRFANERSGSFLHCTNRSLSSCIAFSTLARPSAAHAPEACLRARAEHAEEWGEILLVIPMDGNGTHGL